MENKKTVLAGISINEKADDGTIRNHILKPEDLARILGISGEITDLGVFVYQNHAAIGAHVSPHEAEYPSINVNGANGQKPDTLINIAHVELPNEHYPDSITARLYAGYSGAETDDPIAVVRTKLRTKKEITDMARHAKQTRSFPAKLVHVDTDLAKAVPWDSTEERVKEHDG